MKFLVTGGAGFIGSQIVLKLVAEGHQVKVLDNLSTGKLENLSSVMQTVKFIQGDIRDAGVVLDALADTDIVIHQAAKISVVESLADPVGFHETNVTGTLHILEACRELQVRRVVLASSSAVYGASENLPLQELEPAAPLSPYGLTKDMDERYARAYHDLYGLETVCLRYFNVFGPGQRADSPYAAVIPKFAEALSGGGTVTIFGDGEQTRDFVYVTDVARANCLAGITPGIGGEVINIAGGRSVSVNRIFQALTGILGVKAQPQYQAERAGEIRHSLADIRKAERRLGFKPEVSLEEGLQLIVKENGVK